MVVVKFSTYVMFLYHNKYMQTVYIVMTQYMAMIQIRYSQHLNYLSNDCQVAALYILMLYNVYNILL